MRRSARTVAPTIPNDPPAVVLKNQGETLTMQMRALPELNRISRKLEQIARELMQQFQASHGHQGNIIQK